MINRVPILVWFLVPTAVILGFGVWFFSRSESTLGVQDETKPISVSSPVAEIQEFAIVGREHVDFGTPVTTYNSNPPTSGPHWPGSAKNGVYDNQLPDEQLIHNLEHGYIWISYRPTGEATDSAGISEDEKKKLTEIVAGDDWKMILEPREANDSKIALVAWGRVLNMQQFDESKIKDFIKTYRNRGPEKTPD
ncbi:MAG: DUF3105 domain-containing protein [Candidatus Curtissbacteria bacterium]|nr:DUF3105 domain-containing protein [Candidatus Curtissbacteria bacterium]